MPTISLATPTALTVITAGLHATNYNAIQTLLNGGLKNDNIASDAAIDASKISGGGVRTTRLPVHLTHANDGNSWWGVSSGTQFQWGHWNFLKDVAGYVWGHVVIPTNVAATANAKFRVELFSSATSGVTRLGIEWRTSADNETLNWGSRLGSVEGGQDITVPGTAYLRKTVTFTPTGDTFAANDYCNFLLIHDGAHANDTLAVNTTVLGVWLEIDVNV